MVDKESFIDITAENTAIEQWGQDLVEKWSAQWGSRILHDDKFRGALLSICLVREMREEAHLAALENAYYGNRLTGVTDEDLAKYVSERKVS